LESSPIRSGLAGNTLSVDTSGQVLLTGTAVLSDYLYVTMGDFVEAAANAPGKSAFKTNLLLYWFDKVATEMLYFVVGIPGGFLEASDIGIWVDWVPASTSTGSVTWGGGFSASLRQCGSTHPYILSISGIGEFTADKYYSSNLGTITAAAGLQSWDYLAGRLFRDARTYAGDSYDNDVGRWASFRIRGSPSGLCLS
jgi:hypothetical protein